VLAAALCGHTGCAPSEVVAGQDSHTADVDASAHETHEGHPEAPGHGDHAEHDSSAAEHSEDGSPGTDAPAVQETSFPYLSQYLLASGAGPCGHCMSDPGPLKTTASERQAEQPRRQNDSVTAPPTCKTSPPDCSYVREVIPSQGAPPGRVSAYVLHSVFRI
jgi:hypothetical protein